VIGLKQEKTLLSLIDKSVFWWCCVCIMSDTIRSLLGDSAKASGYIQHQKELKRYDLPLDASVEDLEKAKKLAAEKDLVSQFSPDEFSLYRLITGK
jgi:hypothetical protein